MNARIDQWRAGDDDRLSAVWRCLGETLPEGIARDAVEEAAKRVLAGREDVATVRELLHRYRDDGSMKAEDCERVIGVLEARVNEDVDTIPGVAPTSGESDDPFTRTTVLPPDAGVASGDANERLQVGSVLRDRFLLQERVAGGSMGVVYKALDRRLAEVEGVDPWVAIKVLSRQLAGNADALRALQQEAAKGRCLTHPNIVRFIDFDREDDVYFLVMEWLEGRSLAAVLDAGDRQPDLAASLEIVRQTGEALSYAHRCGVIHADVKPANVMVLPSGAIKLFDFGIARVRQQGSDHDPRFDPGVLGAATPAYSSMQVLTGEEPTIADDVFSLGCLAYRLIAGHRVFGPRNAAEAAENGMEPQRPHQLAEAQWKALRKALSHSRVARYRSIAEFLEALLTPAPAPRGVEPLVVPEQATVERRSDERRRRWPYALIVLLAGAVAVTFFRPAWVTDAITAAEDWLGKSLDAARPTGGETAVEADAAGEPAAETSGVEAVPEGAAPDETADAGVSPAASAPGSAAEAAEAGPSAATETTAPPATATAAAEDRAAAAAPDAAGTAAATESVSAPPEATPPAGFSGLVLPAPGQARPEMNLELREGEDAVTLEVYRWFDLGEPLTVRIDEVGYSGNRAPGDAGQYTLSDGGVLGFDPGQRTASFAIRMPADSEREADQQVSLLLRDYYNVNAELGMLNLSLLDDDQRAFEADHAANTIAFAEGRVIVPERDPAAQIDVLRLNPDRRTMTVSYRVQNVSATDGEDYFSPSRRSVTFGPGQRTARLLIPLVQDYIPEADESFTIELDVPETDPNTFRRIAVIIRDDD